MQIHKHLTCTILITNDAVENTEPDIEMRITFSTLQVLKTRTINKFVIKIFLRRQLINKYVFIKGLFKQKQYWNESFLLKLWNKTFIFT